MNNCETSPTGKHQHRDRRCIHCGRVKNRGHKCSRGEPDGAPRRSWWWNDGMRSMNRPGPSLPGDDDTGKLASGWPETHGMAVRTT